MIRIPAAILGAEAPGLALVIVACIAALGCQSAGKAQLPIDQKPLAIVDAATGVTLERVLILPRYMSSKGVSTGTGHGPGYMAESSFLALPFVYLTGTPFAPVQPESTGLLVGPVGFFVGRGVTIQGAIAVAPAHRPAWVWELWDRSPASKVLLEPLSESEARQRNARLRSLLAARRIRGSDLTEAERDAFGMAADSALDVRFSPAEQQLVRDFLTK